MNQVSKCCEDSFHSKKSDICDNCKLACEVVNKIVNEYNLGSGTNGMEKNIFRSIALVRNS